MVPWSLVHGQVSDEVDDRCSLTFAPRSADELGHDDGGKQNGALREAFL
jgi:hypothetical protein